MEPLGNRQDREAVAHLGLRNFEEPVVLPHGAEGPADNDRNNPPIAVGEIRQAAPEVVDESNRVRFRLQWDKYLDMLLRLPLLFLMDQILLQDMGINYFTRSNYTSQALKMEGSAPGYTNSNNVQFHFNSDPNFTLQKDAFLKSKQEEAEQKYQQIGNASPSNPALMTKPVEATATEIYQSLYGNPDWAVLPHMAYCLAMVYAYLIALFVVLMLNTKQLKWFYTYLLCASFIPISYLINAITITQLSSSDYVESNLEAHSFLSSILNRTIIVNYLAQAGIGYLVTTLLRHHLNNNAHWLVNDLLPFSMLFPSILTIVGLEPKTLRIVALISILPSAAITIASLWHGLGSAFRSVRHSIESKRQVMRHFGLNALLEAEWTRLHVPSLLRTFWLTRCAQQLLVSFIKLIGASGLTPLLVLPTLDSIVVALINTAKELLTRGNETTIAVLGMTSIVSTLCHHIGSMFHFILTQNSSGNVGGPENDEEKSVASVSAVLFFVLALQTGLTSLEPDKRFARLCKNLCLLVTALFHFVHNMVSPVLMSLSAARVINYRRHLRALSICVFLTCAPLTLMMVLWKWFPIGTWLLAVSAFCVEVVVKVLVTVAVYGLFLYDSKVREGAWEGLDDAVYYVRAAGNTVEFCFAVFLFFNGGWILLFESGGTIRALMMLIHAYCNIWCEARSGKLA